jgi:hypothetical protein
MVLFNVQVEKMGGGKVLFALETAMRVLFRVVHFVVLKARKGEGLLVWREGASHLCAAGRGRYCLCLGCRCLFSFVLSFFTARGGVEVVELGRLMIVLLREGGGIDGAGGCCF